MSAAREVLVTGAAGFIGRHLVGRLAGEGHAVTAVDVAETSSFGSLPGEVRYERCDVRDTETLEKLLPVGGDVFHLASVHLEVGEEETVFEDVNVRAAADLVEACRRKNVRRMIHTSSVGIYGHVEDPPATEDGPKSPQTPYERTKLAGERAVRERANDLEMDVIVLRPAWVYGPGCPRTAKLLDAVRSGKFFYIGAGDNLRHPLYIDDMLEAYRLAAEASESVLGRAYLIGGPRYMRLKEMVGTFARALDVSEPRIHIPRPVGWSLGLVMEGAFALTEKKPPFSRRSLAFFDNDNAFDIGAAQRDLGFDPSVDLDEGVRRTLEASADLQAVA